MDQHEARPLPSSAEEEQRRRRIGCGSTAAPPACSDSRGAPHTDHRPESRYRGHVSLGSFGLQGEQRSFDSGLLIRRGPSSPPATSSSMPSLGTGLSSVVTGTYREAIELINSAGKPVIAVDIPSGLHADTGAILGRAIRATLTITCGLPKLGLYVDAGIDQAGAIRVVDIGIPPAYVDAIESRTLLLTSDSAFQSLPERVPSAHKGTFGHAGIIAGSVGKPARRRWRPRRHSALEPAW